jgi:hypothetical protein
MSKVRFVGLDVHAEAIAVAIANLPEGRPSPRLLISDLHLNSAERPHRLFEAVREPLSFSSHSLWRFILTKPDESCMPKVIPRCPFQKFELPD